MLEVKIETAKYVKECAETPHLAVIINTTVPLALAEVFLIVAQALQRQLRNW